MTVFWLVVGLFLAGTLLALLPPLLRPAASQPAASDANAAVYRDQWNEAALDLEQGQVDSEGLPQVQADIRRRLADDLASVAKADAAGSAPRASWPAAALLALALPAISVGTYLALGRPDAVELQARAPDAVASPARHDLTPAQVELRVAALAERLAAQPRDADGWIMLGRSYTALGRFRDAATALRRAVELRPADPGLLADLADLVAMVQGKRLAGEPARLVQQALDLDPRHVKALALAGSVAFEAGDGASARGYWERLAALLPADSERARALAGSLAEARRLEAGQSGAARSTGGAEAGAISGRVEITPALAARVRPGDTLFVFARAAEGPRQPLAILRRAAGDLPLDFTLDDSMAMPPGSRLATHARVSIGARISRSGQALPQSGDLRASAVISQPGAQGVRLLIDDVQP